MDVNMPDLATCKEVVIGTRDIPTIIKKQKNLRGWNNTMKECLVGPCKLLMDNGSDATVIGPSGNMYRLNSELLVKYNSVKKHTVGSVVQLIEDEDEFKLLQSLNLKWNDKMKNILGKKVQIVQVFKDGDYKIKYNNKTFIIHPKTISEIDEKSSTKVNPKREFDHSDESDDENVIKSEGTIRLFFALQTGNINEVSKIVDFVGVDTNLNGIYPLFIAVNEGHEDVVNLLLERKANINITDKDGDTALHLAVQKNRFRLCELLIKKGADVNVQNDMKITPIMLATLIGSQDILKLLISSSNADLSIGDCNKDTALHLAVISYKIDSVKTLMSAGADLHLFNKKLFNPFHVAALCGHEKILEIFLKKDEKIINSQKEDKVAAIHLAALNNHENCLRLLIKYNADINIRSDDLKAALHMAVMEKYLKCVKVLVENKADLDVKDEDGDTPLHVAMKANSMKEFGRVIRMPEILGIPVNIREGSDKLEDIVIYLIKKGASTDIKNKNGETPLDICKDNSLKKKIFELTEDKSTKQDMIAKD